MRWIWQKYDETNRFFIDENAPIFSPYLEINNCQGKDISVNPWLRFYDIFHPLVKNSDKMKETKEKDYSRKQEEIVNLIFHLLARLDEWGRLHPFFLAELILEMEIKRGLFGDLPLEVYSHLDSKEKDILLHYLRIYLENQGRNNFFSSILQEFFPKSVLYYHVPEDEFILYIPTSYTEEKEKKIKLLIHFFFDITYSLKKENIFWGHHFGIVDVENTMRVDNLVVY